MTKFERPKSLTELVAEEVRGQIVDGRVELGSLLSEGRLARELDVSRTPVREAFNRLESEGLVRTEPQRGTFVFSLEPNELAKICDVRVCLETAALEAAFDVNRKNLVKRLKRCTAAMTAARKAGDDNAYLREDTRFHQTIVDCAENPFLNDAYQTISNKMAALRLRLGMHPHHMEKSYREHLEMVDCTNTNDLQRALKILTGHIDRKDGSYWAEAASEDSFS